MTPPTNYAIAEVQFFKVVFNKHLVLHEVDPTDETKKLHDFTVGKMGDISGIWVKPTVGDWHFIPSSNVHDIRVRPVESVAAPTVQGPALSMHPSKANSHKRSR